MHPNHIETGINSEIQQLTEKLHKPIIRKLQKSRNYTFPLKTTSGVLSNQI